MERKVLITADSICDMGEELKARYGVIYHPFHIILDGKDYLDDGMDITPMEMFAQCKQKKILPQTSAINSVEYVRFFKPFVDKGYEIVHFCLASTLSSAYEHCVIAAKEFESVHVIDSCNLSCGVALQIICAGDMAKEGLSAKEIADKIRSMRKCFHASFVLDTLDYMAAGGRCSNVLALLASAISLKPSIDVFNDDGHMDLGRKYRGKQEKVLKNYIKDQLSAYDNIVLEHAFVCHSGIDDELAQELRRYVLELKPFKEVHITTASCTISSHCGPACMGILFMTEAEDR